ARDDALETRLHRPLHEILPGLTVLDELVKECGWERGAMIALVLEDDLGQGHRRQVFAGGGIHHRDLLAGANHLLDFLEGDVATFLRIVELSIRVPRDDVRHGTRLRDGFEGHYDGRNTPRQVPGPTSPC